MILANPNLDNRLNHLSLVFELDAGGGMTFVLTWSISRISDGVGSLGLGKRKSEGLGKAASGGGPGGGCVFSRPGMREGEARQL